MGGPKAQKSGKTDHSTQAKRQRNGRGKEKHTAKNTYDQDAIFLNGDVLSCKPPKR
jgi:hypothetical protein